VRLENDERLSKTEWVSTHIGLGIVIAGALLLEEVPHGDWQQAAGIVGLALVMAVLAMVAVRAFSRKAASACVPLKAEVNRNVPV
jgi:hypothetical protein